MKICFVTTGDIVSMATMKRATGMSEPLIHLGHEVAIIAEETKNNKERFELECPNAISLFFQKGSFIYEYKQKKKLIKNWKPDIVYVCAFGFRNWIHKYNTNSKCTIVEHSELSSAIRNNKKKYIYWVIEYLSTVLFNRQIYASRYLENHFSKGLKGFFTKGQSNLYSPYAYNKRLSIKHDSKLYSILNNKYIGKHVILYMGTLSLNYGFLDIIKAANRLKEKRNDFIVLIIGSGQHKTIGEKYINDNHLDENIELLGYVAESQISTYFKLADLFISPLFDTIQDKARCPSKLFMYIPFNKPVITCKIGEAKELFGDSGYYYEPENISELSSLIGNILDNNREITLINKEKHSWDYRAIEFNNWFNKGFET